MPQVANLLKLSSQSAAPSSRKAFLSEPNQKFEDVLKNQSSRKNKPLDEVDRNPPAAKTETEKKTDESKDSADAEKSEKSNKPKADKKEATGKAKSNKEVKKKEDQPSDEVENAQHAEKKSKAEKDVADQTDDSDADVVELVKTDEPKTSGDASKEDCDSLELSAQAQAAMNQPSVDPAAANNAPSSDTEAAKVAASTGRVAVDPKAAKIQIKADQKIDGNPEPAPLELPKDVATQDDDQDTDDADDLKMVDAHEKAFKTVETDKTDTAATDFSAELNQVVDSEQNKTQNPIQVHQPSHVQQTVAPERHFSENNVERIVTNISGNLSSNGGTMKIRLDPPNLGELHVNVTVDQDGTLSASFQTSNEEATRLLSHNIQNLKSSLEATGVNVDKIQVKQAAPSEQSSSQNGSSEQDRHQQHAQDHPARQEQQRREILEKMWRKMVFGEEPLDLVA